MNGEREGDVAKAETAQIEMKPTERRLNRKNVSQVGQMAWVNMLQNVAIYKRIKKLNR